MTCLGSCWVLFTPVPIFISTVPATTFSLPDFTLQWHLLWTIMAQTGRVQQAGAWLLHRMLANTFFKSATACVVPVGHQVQTTLPVSFPFLSPSSSSPSPLHSCRLQANPPVPRHKNRPAPVVNRTLFFLGQAIGRGYYAVRRAILEPGAMDGVGSNNTLIVDMCNGHGVNGTQPVCGSSEAQSLLNPHAVTFP